MKKYNKKVQREVVEMRNSGLSYKEVAVRLNMATGTAHAIYKRVTKNGVKLQETGHKRLINQDTFDLVKLLSKNGLETKAIMDIVKLSRGAVCRLVKSDTLESYRNTLRTLRLNRLEALKAKTVQAVPMVVKSPEVVENVRVATTLTFDQYNTIMARLNSLQFDLGKVAETLEKKRFKFF